MKTSGYRIVVFAGITCFVSLSSGYGDFLTGLLDGVVNAVGEAAVDKVFDKALGKSGLKVQFIPVKDADDRALIANTLAICPANSLVTVYSSGVTTDRFMEIKNISVVTPSGVEKALGKPVDIAAMAIADRRTILKEILERTSADAVLCPVPAASDMDSSEREVRVVVEVQNKNGSVWSETIVLKAKFGHPMPEWTILSQQFAAVLANHIGSKLKSLPSAVTAAK